MHIKEVMTRTPACCLPTTRLDEVARMMVDHDCGEIPVVRSRENKELVGVITDRDICCRAVAQRKIPSEMSASECMTSPVFTVSPDIEISQACRIFEDKEVRRLPVVDSKNCVVGIVSLADLVDRAPEQYAREVLRYASKQPGAGAALL